jgi:hypothetical protein
VCLSDFMTTGDRERGDLVQVLGRETVEVRHLVNAAHCRNTALSARIACFLDFLAQGLSGMR